MLHFASLVNKNDFVDSVVRFLDPARFEVMVCTFTNKADISSPDYLSYGLKHFVLDVNGRKEYLRAIKKLIEIIKREKVDILHTHLFDEAFIGSVAARLVPRLKFVLGRHYSNEIYLTAKGLQRTKSLLIEGFANKRADAIVAASSIIRDLLIKQGVPIRKIYRINYGFDFKADKYQLLSDGETERVRQELNIGLDTFVIANVGRHYFLKGQPLLLRAFKKFSEQFEDSRLLMVGDGPSHHELKDLTKHLNLEEKVLFTGWRKDGKQLISASNVVVQPTFTEAFPQIMVEAMALAKPLIISNVSGPCDQVKDLETGYLVPVNDVNAIYESLLKIKTMPEQASTIGINARHYVMRNLDITVVIKGYESLYEEVMSK